MDNLCHKPYIYICMFHMDIGSYILVMCIEPNEYIFMRTTIRVRPTFEKSYF